MLYIDGKELKHVENVQYAIIYLERNIWTGKFKYTIDVGQANSMKSEITTDSGKPMKFKSEVDAMNFMYHVGWKHYNTTHYTNPSTGGGVVKMIFEKRNP